MPGTPTWHKARGLRTHQGLRRKVNADLANDTCSRAARSAASLVLHKELDADDGELTRTNKVRRGFIGENTPTWSRPCTAAEQYIETQVKFEDGRTGSVSATPRFGHQNIHGGEISRLRPQP